MSFGQTEKGMHPLLKGLFSSEFQSLALIAGSDQAFYAALLKSPVVNEIREGLFSGQLGEHEIRLFVEQLLLDFDPKELFAHDSILAALAVALSSKWNTPFAEEFIIDLARLSNPSFRRSIAVARMASKRLFGGTETTTRSYAIRWTVHPSRAWRLLPPQRDECIDHRGQFHLRIA